MTKRRISTDLAPASLPVFSQGVRKGNIVQVSGQGGVDATTGVFSDDVTVLPAMLVEIDALAVVGDQPR